MTGVVMEMLGGSFVPPTTTHTYQAASGTESIISGYAFMDVELWQAGAGGGGRNTTVPNNGGGGGGGSLSKLLNVSISGQVGKTFNYALASAPADGGDSTGTGATGGAPSASSISSGTFTITAMNMNVAATPGTGGSTGGPGTAGNGGTSTGGTLTSGNNGSGASGGARITGSHGQQWGAGGSGGAGHTPPDPGTLIVTYHN